MKSTYFLLFFFLLTAATGFSQKNSKLATPDVVWYGLDFSKAKMIGSTGFTNPDDIADRFLKNWNFLIKAEAEKYDLAEFYGKPDVKYDLNVVKERNDKVDADELVIDDDHTISKETVEAVVKSYAGDKNDSGLGLVYVIESFDKNKKKGIMWVTFFDIATHEVIHTEKMDGKAGGFGIKNYWARSVYEVMKKCKKEFENW